MNTPISWIKAYVPDLDCTVQEYVDKMTLSGSHVENAVYLDKNLEKIVVGRIEKIEKHTDNYDFLDLNGLANSFGQSSPYYKYNESKIGMNPDVYEFIGEFDYIIDEGKFRRIQAAGLLSEEFKPSYRLESEQ